MPFPIYDKQADVPEPFREEYEEREGKWHPKVPDVTKLNTALERERQKARDEEKARKDAERERDEFKRKQEAREKGISDEELKKIRDDEEKARKPILDENEALKAENRKLKLNDRLRDFAIKHGIKKERLEDAMDLLLLKGRADLSAEGNLVFKDAAGAVTAQTPEEFFGKTFKTEKPWLYEGTGSSGADTTGSTTTGSTTTGSDGATTATVLDAAAKAGKAAGEAQKRTAETNQLAYR